MHTRHDECFTKGHTQDAEVTPAMCASLPLALAEGAGAMPNFRFTEFRELRLNGVLGSSGLLDLFVTIDTGASVEKPRVEDGHGQDKGTAQGRTLGSPGKPGHHQAPGVPGGRIYGA